MLYLKKVLVIIAINVDGARTAFNFLHASKPASLPQLDSTKIHDTDAENT
jgi:hypothetical protein